MQQKISEWKDITQSWFLPRLLKQRKFCKELSLFSLQGRVNKEQVLPALQQLLFYQQQKQEVDSSSRWFEDLFGNKSHPGEEQWDDIEVMSKAILQLNRLLVEVVDDPMSIRRVKEKLAEQLSEGYSLFPANESGVVGRFGIRLGVYKAIGKIDVAIIGRFQRGASCL